MTDNNMGVHPMEDPEAQLERAFIDEYLRLHGHDPEAASIYAAGKLAEFESRAHYVHDIHAKD